MGISGGHLRDSELHYGMTATVATSVEWTPTNLRTKMWQKFRPGVPTLANKHLIYDV